MQKPSVLSFVFSLLTAVTLSVALGISFYKGNLNAGFGWSAALGFFILGKIWKLASMYWQNEAVKLAKGVEQVLRTMTLNPVSPFSAVAPASEQLIKH